MTIDDYINSVKNGCYNQSGFDKYIIDYGCIDKLKKKNLDKMIPGSSDVTISNDSFIDIYRMVSANESGRIIKIWTWIVRTASLVSLDVSIIGLIKCLTFNKNNGGFLWIILLLICLLALFQE